jgi:Uma2 family endonuclease
MSTPTERREPQTPPPTAPTQAAWDAMTPEARAAALAQLGPMPDHEASPPEGDWHIEAVRVSEDALDGQFQKRGRGVYIGRGITVYSPEERRFAPDLFVVLDVPTHKRTTWVVSAEQRGLDFVLEVHYGGHRRKDAELNVERYARLGIPEYFMFDARRVLLQGWRLERPGDRVYTRIVPQNGRWQVRALGLELGLRDGLPRWYDGISLVPLTREMNLELSRSLNDALERAEQAEADRDRETARAQAEAERAQAAEEELARLRAELARLRGE